MTPPLATTTKMTCVIEATRNVSSRASTKLGRRLGGGEDGLSLLELKPKVGVPKKPSNPYSNYTMAASRAETGSCSQSHPHLILPIRLLIPKTDIWNLVSQTERRLQSLKIMILKSQLHRERLVCSRIEKHLREDLGWRDLLGTYTQAKDIVLYIIINYQVLIRFSGRIGKSNHPVKWPLPERVLINPPFKTLSHSSRFVWITTQQTHQPSEVGLGSLQY